MATQPNTTKTELPNGVIFNAYPDSIGKDLSDIVEVLKRSEFKDVFSLFYILPTIFNSDLDRGFSVIDYDLNEELVTPKNLDELHKLNMELKLDLVLNHLSVGSPQFQDMLQHGSESKYTEFFINWNEFWDSHGEMGPDGYVIPRSEYKEKLFMRKPGFPVLKVRFPDGSDQPYWNTFYQEVKYPEITATDLRINLGEDKLNQQEAEDLARLVNQELVSKKALEGLVLNGYSQFKENIISFVEQKRQYLGQMDLNAQSELVWDFYDDTLKKLRNHGAKLLRLDAFAYLHKEPGKSNFFNKPGTWDYLARLKKIADKYELILLPEIHSEYGTGIHEEVAGEGYPVYDFFFPGLVIHALDNGNSTFLKRWIDELLEKDIRTINMLGCHDGIPVLDLKGKEVNGSFREGLLSDEELDSVIDNILDRGGRVKNLYGPDGKKISYYQVNATFFSAIGENEQKLLLARAIQMFMPGIPQVWYLDLFAGKNDYAAADKGGTGGHKEINRTTLSIGDIDEGLQKSVVQDQLALMRLRNTASAFAGELTIADTDDHLLDMTWQNDGATATLHANLLDHSFAIRFKEKSGEETVKSYR